MGFAIKSWFSLGLKTIFSSLVVSYILMFELPARSENLVSSETIVATLDNENRGKNQACDKNSTTCCPNPELKDGENQLALEFTLNRDPYIEILSSQLFEYGKGLPLGVDRIKLKNSFLGDQEEVTTIVNNVLREFSESKLTDEEIKLAIADKLTLQYIQEGFLTTRVKAPEEPEAEEITDNSWIFTVQEGRIEGIEVNYTQGEQNLRQEYICDRLRHAAQIGKILNFTLLEERMRFLKADPLFANISANLRASHKETNFARYSDLVVNIEEANPSYGKVTFDNYSPASIGSERFKFSGGIRNLTGNGDELSLAYTRSITGGSSIFDIGYQIPLSAQNNNLSFRAVIDRNKVTQQPLDILDIQGESELYEIYYHHPLIRRLHKELTLSAGLSFKNGQTFIFNDIPQAFGRGPDRDGVSQTSVLHLSQNYIHRDAKGAWAFKTTANLGLDLFGSTQNEGNIPDSSFVSLALQAQRVQLLSEETDKHRLVMQGNFQFSFNPLLASNQFVVGGGQSVRGYRQNARSADNGLRFSIADHITLKRSAVTAEATFQLIPFIDVGWVWNHPDNPNKLPDQNFLLSTGLGIWWKPHPDLTFQIDYALPFIDLKDRGNNIQDAGFYIKADYNL